MTILLMLVPLMMGLGLLGLAAFIWSVKSGQYRDLDGDSHRILEDHDAPLPPEIAKQRRKLTSLDDEV